MLKQVCDCCCSPTSIMFRRRPLLFRFSITAFPAAISSDAQVRILQVPFCLFLLIYRVFICLVLSFVEILFSLSAVNSDCTLNNNMNSITFICYPNASMPYASYLQTLDTRVYFRKATSHGNRKLAQNICFFGLTNRTL